MNITAKAQRPPGPRRRLRDWGLSRPELVAAWTRLVRPLAQFGLRSSVLRALADACFGLARRAPLPLAAASPLRHLRSDIVRAAPSVLSGDKPRVAYFHGCSTGEYEPWLGEMTIQVLDRLGVEVELPPQVCCGLPLQSNHALGAARGYAQRNLAALRPWAERGIPIVGTSTSCTLALKHEYRGVLGLAGAEVDAVGQGTYDIFEYLIHVLWADRAEPSLQPVPLRVLYHAPCQLRAHRIGAPALQVLRKIPGLQLQLSDAECCGVAGTYGLKSERYEVAVAVGRELFRQAASQPFDCVVTDSETCRWWIAEHSGLPSVHPIELLSAALGLPGLRPSPRKG
jgi:glycerol-3-phosphate dehydrogenase subunit C